MRNYTTYINNHKFNIEETTEGVIIDWATYMDIKFVIALEELDESYEVTGFKYGIKVIEIDTDNRESWTKMQYYAEEKPKDLKRYINSVIAYAINHY